MRGFDLLGRNVLQGEDDVDPPQHEHTILDFDFSVGDGRQTAFAGNDPARFQRAAQCAEQSPAGCSDHVVDRRRVRFGNITLYAVVACDRTVRTEAHRLLFRRHVRETEWPPDSCQRNLRLVDDIAHTCITASDRPRRCSEDDRRDPPGET